MAVVETIPITKLVHLPTRIMRQREPPRPSSRIIPIPRHGLLLLLHLLLLLSKLLLILEHRRTRSLQMSRLHLRLTDKIGMTRRRRRDGRHLVRRSLLLLSVPMRGWRLTVIRGRVDGHALELVLGRCDVGLRLLGGDVGGDGGGVGVLDLGLGGGLRDGGGAVLVWVGVGGVDGPLGAFGGDAGLVVGLLGELVVLEAGGGGVWACGAVVRAPAGQAWPELDGGVSGYACGSACCGYTVWSIGGLLPRALAGIRGLRGVDGKIASWSPG